MEMYTIGTSAFNGALLFVGVLLIAVIALERR